MPSYQPVAAVQRGLQVLGIVSRLERATVGDIFKISGINRPTIVRMLETLQHAGFVFRDPKSATYSVTGKTIELSRGYRAELEVASAASPILRTLQRKIGWPSDVAVFDGDAMIVAATSRDLAKLFLSRKPGHRAPVFGTSMGRAYIAFATDAERERAFEFARRSADPWDQIAHDGVRAAADLQVVRRQGFAVMDLDYSKREYGGSVTTIGVPVLLGDRAVASLTVMFLRETVDQEEAERKLVPAAKDAADEISTALAASR